MTKDEIFNIILHDMADYVEAEKLLILRSILYKNFCNYDISMTETSVALLDEDFDTDILKKYVIDLKICGRSDKTISQYLFSIRQFLDAIHKSIRDVTTDDVEKYIALILLVNKNSNVTVRNKTACLRPFFLWAYEKNYILNYPFKNIKPIKCEKKIKEVLTDHDMVLLRDACKDNPRTLAMIDFLSSTGVRVSEFINLNISDVDFVTGAVTVYGKKTRTWRKTYLNTSASKHLSDYLSTRKDDHESLFITMKRPYRRLSRYSVEEILKSSAKRAGVNKHCTVHLFRRTLATNLHSKGMELDYIAKMLGHTVSTLEQCYLVTNDSDVRNSYYNHAK